MAEIEARKRSKEERAEALAEFHERVALDKAFAIEAMEVGGEYMVGLLQARLSASVAAQNRLPGTPPQSLQHSGKDGGPIVIVTGVDRGDPSADGGE